MTLNDNACTNVYKPGDRKHPHSNGFSSMILHENGCFTKLPLKTGFRLPGIYIECHIHLRSIITQPVEALRDATFQVLKGQGMLKAIRPFRNKNERQREKSWSKVPVEN